jgi:hypothetical protein
MRVNLINKKVNEEGGGIGSIIIQRGEMINVIE